MPQGRGLEWQMDGVGVKVFFDGSLWYVWSQALPLHARTYHSKGPAPCDCTGLIPEARIRAPFGPIALRPHSLDRPLLIKLNHDFVIKPGEELVRYLSIPVSFHLLLEKNQILTPVNTVTLTKTWFGDTSEGLPCFLVPVDSADFSDQDSLPLARHSLALVKIHVRNFGRNELQLKRFILNPKHLALWEIERGLRTDDVFLTAQNDQNLTTVSKKPRDQILGECICPAEIVESTLVWKRGVDFLKILTGIGESSKWT